MTALAWWWAAMPTRAAVRGTPGPIPLTPSPTRICRGEMRRVWMALLRPYPARPLTETTTVRARLQTFHNQTESLIDYYRRAGLLIEVNGEGDVADVTRRTLEAVQNLARS